MSARKCDRCTADIAKDLPRPGGIRFWGVVTMTSWRIRFNRLRMNTWEKAVTAMDVIGSKTYTDVELCDRCWGDVLSFISDTKTRS